MARSPGSQSRDLMAKKRQVAAQLLTRGLTVRQVSMQLNCSAMFVRKVRQELEAHGEAESPAEQVHAWNGVERRSGRDRRSRAHATHDRRSDRDRRRGAESASCSRFPS